MRRPPRRDPGQRRGAPNWLVVSLIGVCAAGLLAHFAVPWTIYTLIPRQPDRWLGWDDYARLGGTDYDKHLVQWPWFGYALAAVALSTLRLLQGPKRSVDWRIVWLLWGAVSFGGFLVALTGTRWLGFFFARLADSGPSFFYLHVTPYVHVLFGSGLLLAGLFWVTQVERGRPRRDETPSSMALAGNAAAASTAAALLLLPLLPFAVAVGFDGSRFHLDELTMASLAAAPNAAHTKAADDLTLARNAMWTVLLGAIAIAGWSGAGSRNLPGIGRSIRFLPLVLLLPLAVAIAATAALYADLPRLADQPKPTIERVDYGLNAVLPTWELVVVLTMLPLAGRLRNRGSPEPEDGTNQGSNA